jgi:hypothetical protein
MPDLAGAPPTPPLPTVTKAVAPPTPPRTPPRFADARVQTLFARQLRPGPGPRAPTAPLPSLPPLAGRRVVSFTEPAGAHPRRDPRSPAPRFGGDAPGAHWMTGALAAAPFAPELALQALALRDPVPAGAQGRLPGVEALLRAAK